LGKPEERCQGNWWNSDIRAPVLIHKVGAYKSPFVSLFSMIPLDILREEVLIPSSISQYLSKEKKSNRRYRPFQYITGQWHPKPNHSWSVLFYFRSHNLIVTLFPVTTLCSTEFSVTFLCPSLIVICFPEYVWSSFFLLVKPYSLSSSAVS
jgi:hypothetical protein